MAVTVTLLRNYSFDCNRIEASMQWLLWQLDILFDYNYCSNYDDDNNNNN